MPAPRLPLRLLLLAALALAAALVLGLVLTTLNSLLEFHERVAALPLWLRAPLLALGALLLAGLAYLLWRLARPARGGAAPGAGAPPSRDAIQARLDALHERAVDTGALQAELAELDRRHHSGELYVALFGEIATGKSSLIRALAPQAAVAVDVRGGTTRAVSLHRGTLPGGSALTLADVPGSGEVDGALHEQLAREEALRAHAVLYLADADLGRSQDGELRWLVQFGKPLLLVLNKADQYIPAERDALLARWRERYGDCTRAIVAVSAGGSERWERLLADGRRERIERERIPDIEALLAALEHIAAHGAGALEAGRQAAVLARVGQRSDELAREAAARDAAAAVARYTRRAVIGALAAVAPGSDLLIQGALATGLVRELARIHGVAVRELDIEAMLSRVGLTVRSSSAIVLAIAGNALKAFPGLGTLGGGVLHAIAYGLVFDSLGHALADTLAQHAALDAADVETRLRALLAQPRRERVERVAQLAFDALRDRGAGGAAD